MTAEPRRITVSPASELVGCAAIRVESDPPIEVFNVDSGLMAIDDACTHGYAWLSNSWPTDCNPYPLYDGLRTIAPNHGSASGVRFDSSYTLVSELMRSKDFGQSFGLGSEGREQSSFVDMMPFPVTALFTGTPAGVGMSQKPPVYLRPGDTLRNSIEGIGKTTSRPSPLVSSSVSHDGGRTGSAGASMFQTLDGTTSGTGS